MQKAMQDVPAALATYGQAEALCVQFAAQDPKDMLLQRNLAMARARIAVTLFDSNENDRAMAMFQDALDVMRPVAAALPNDAIIQRDTWILNLKTNECLIALGKSAEVLLHHQEWVAIAEKLAGDRDNVQAQMDLAATYVVIGRAYVNARDFPSAIGMYRKAIPVDLAAAQAAPEHVALQRQIWADYIALGGAYLERGLDMELAEDDRLESLRQAQDAFREAAGMVDRASRRPGAAAFGFGETINTRLLVSQCESEIAKLKPDKKPPCMALDVTN